MLVCDRMLEMVARAWSGDATCSKWPLDPACPEATGVQGVLEACLGREGPLKLAFEIGVRNGRSKNAVFCSSVIDISFCSVQLCFVHGHARVSHEHTYDFNIRCTLYKKWCEPAHAHAQSKVAQSKVMQRNSEQRQNGGPVIQ